jgi:6-methylsalicylate decarboxylase
MPIGNTFGNTKDLATFCMTAAAKLFAAGLESYPGMDAATREAIDGSNVLALYPRLGKPTAPLTTSRLDAARHLASRVVIRGVARMMSAG